MILLILLRIHPVKDGPVCAVEVADLITEQEVPGFQTNARLAKQISKIMPKKSF